MARGRMLNKTIATDKRLNKMTLYADWLYLRAIPHLDRDGIIDGDPDTLAVTICPWRLALIADEMPSIIDEWVKSGLVVRYESGDRTALYFVGFQKNQSLEYKKEGASSFAAPPGMKRTDRGLVEATCNDKSTSDNTPDDNPNGSRRGVVDGSSSARPELNGIELNVSEGEDTHASATTEPEAETLPPPTEPTTELAAEPEHQPVTEPEQPFPSVTRITYAQVLDARAKVAKEALPAELFDPPSKSQASTPTEPTPGAAHVISFESGEKIFIQDPVWTGLVGAMLDGLGTRALADTGSVNGKAKRREAIFCLETLCKMSDKFRTVDGIKALFESWKKARPNDGAPLPAYLEEHASKHLSGNVRYPSQSANHSQKQQAKTVTFFNVWSNQTETKVIQ